MKDFREYINESTSNPEPPKKNTNRDKIVKFLKENKNPKIKQIQDFAKSLKLYENELDEIIYSILNEYIDFSMIKKVDENSVGVKTEKEHKPTYDWLKDYYKKNEKFPSEKEFYEHIRDDHFKENKNYYSFLVDMEKKFDDKRFTVK